MNKLELVAKIADDADISEEIANKVLGSIIANIIHVVSNSGEVRLIGFGIFKSRVRGAKLCFNPAGGEKVYVPPAIMVNFSPFKAFKEAINETAPYKSESIESEYGTFG